MSNFTKEQVDKAEVRRKVDSIPFEKRKKRNNVEASIFLTTAWTGYTLSLLLLSERVLILQTSYRHYIHTVLALVGKIADKTKTIIFFSLFVLPFAFFSVFLHIHICGKVNPPH